MDKSLLQAIEQRLSYVLASNEQSVLIEAMRYSSLNGGKRIRPLLVIASGHISQANFETLLNIGVAIELIHCYSLIHDDLPAMDNDNLRRGQPTCHKQYNEAVAILAGDALQSEAFFILSNDNLCLNDGIKLKIINLLAFCVGVHGMAGGQALDLLSTGSNLTLPQLQQMHLKKTGALIKAAVLAGYLAGKEYDKLIYEKLDLIANNIGLLFQITDDILDLTSSTATLGKTANKDLVNNKATYVNILGLEQAVDMSNQVYNNVLNELYQLPQHDELVELIHFVYKRSN